MDDIYSLGEKWIRSVASSRQLIRSSSGRPEVPARAAAAAAVARKIAALPPHERLSLSERPGSVYTTRPRGAPAEELEQVFYEDNFDPIRHMLEHIPDEGVNQGYFDNKVGQKLLQLDVITESLSKQVMEHHEEMVKGMQLVTELDRDLQVASIIVKNGRRFLARATFEVSQDLVVAGNVRKKQVLLDMAPVLERVHQALDIKSRLDGVVDEGNFCKALHMCSECLLLLEDCPEMLAVQEMNQSIEEWLQRTISKVDVLLMEVCRKFDVEKYKTVINAYTLLDDVTSLADKVQSFFAQNVVTETHDVLKNLLFQGEDEQTAQKKGRLPYRDLCMQLPEAKFRQFLCKTLEVLFELMCSYHTMMTWHQQPESLEIETPAEDPPAATRLNGKLHHRRSGSHGDLSHIVRESRHVRTGSLSSESFVIPLSPTSVHASRLLTRNGSRRKLGSDNTEVYENGTSSSAEFDNHSVGEDYGTTYNLAKREEVVIGTVARALERGRKSVWEIAARRVAALLSNDAVCQTSPHQFLQSLDWVNKFILAGEAFCGAEAVSLRTKLTKQSEMYFGAYHCQNLEVLRMVVERELWQPLSSFALKSVNLAGLTGHGASLVRASATSDLSGSSQGVGTLSSGVGRAGFADWLQKGNPFSEKGQQSSLTSKVVGGDAMNVNGTDKAGFAMNGTVKVDDDDDDENEDLLADFIDEDSQLPSRLYHKFRKSTSTMESKDSQSIGDDKSLVLTNSSVNILRYMDKYARLMQIMQPVASDVFKGLSQLFELYFFSIFKTFGQREAFAGGRSQDSYLLTPRLRATLLRISQALEEQRLKQASSNIAQTAMPNLNPGTGVPSPTGIGSMQSDAAPSPVFGGAAIVMSPTNLFAIKERTVATDSLACLAQMLKRSRPLLQCMLAQESLAAVEFFYTRSVDAVSDLKEHVYKAVARMLLNIGGYIDRIANVRWELKDLGMEHNGYVDSLLGAYKQFSTKINYGGLEKEMQELLLEYGVDTLAETIVEGFSRIRRCNNEGRALMSLDLQVLINGLQHLAPPRLRSNLQIVETYIKAFYLPETEYLHWVRTHPEYTKSQAVGLINLVAASNNWKRKTRVDMIDRIEAGDL